jgi:hypothetical protein
MHDACGCRVISVDRDRGPSHRNRSHLAVVLAPRLAELQVGGLDAALQLGHLAGEVVGLGLRQTAISLRRRGWYMAGTAAQ